MKERQPCIYKITNLVDGKVYIGQTNRSFSERKRGHLSELRRNIHENAHFQSAWNKYGEENFCFETLQRCETSELDDLEIFWIELYVSTNRKNGYNLESGGNIGKTLSEETRRKISTNTKSLGWIGGKHPNARKVVRINDGVTFDSMTEAGESVGITGGAVYQLCCGNNTATMGVDGIYYQFAYYEDGKEYKLKEIDETRIKTPKKIICLNTKKVFNSMHEAEAKTGVLQSKISLVCNGKRTSAGKDENGNKLIWRFLDDYNPNEKIDFVAINNNMEFKRARKVKCLNTGEIFESARQAGIKYNIKPPSTVSVACRGVRDFVGKLPSGEKLRWSYI